MLKATARRLAAMLHTKPALVLDADPEMLSTMVRKLYVGPRHPNNFGDARRLANKVMRLR